MDKWQIYILCKGSKTFRQEYFNCKWDKTGFQCFSATQRYTGLTLAEFTRIGHWAWSPSKHFDLFLPDLQQQTQQDGDIAAAVRQLKDSDWQSLGPASKHTHASASVCPETTISLQLSPFFKQKRRKHMTKCCKTWKVSRPNIVSLVPEVMCIIRLMRLSVFLTVSNMETTLLNTLPWTLVISLKPFFFVALSCSLV